MLLKILFSFIGGIIWMFVLPFIFPLEINQDTSKIYVMSYMLFASGVAGIVGFLATHLLFEKK